MIRYKFFSGDINWQTYGGKFISQKLNNGDFDYWLIMDVINMWEATAGLYNPALSAYKDISHKWQDTKIARIIPQTSLIV